MPDLSDRDALVCLYEYLHGERRWYENTYWNSEKPCGRWYGVKVDEGAHVKSLVLSDNRLDGYFFENTRFSSLRNLRVLWLNNNVISGQIPRCFGTYMVSMEELNLSWNLFTGAIPDEIFDNMRQLRMLRLDNNQLSGELSPKLGQLTRLRFLQLHNNQLCGEVPRVGHCLPELNLCELLPGNCFRGAVPPDAIRMRAWVPETGRQQHHHLQDQQQQQHGGGGSRGGSRGRTPDRHRRVQIADEGGGGGGSRPGSGSGSRPGSRSRG